MSRSLKEDFIFWFLILIFYFLFLEQLGLGLEGSVTLSHQSQSDGVITTLIMRLERMK